MSLLNTTAIASATPENISDFLELLLQHLQVKVPASVLHVGCKNGSQTKALSEKGFETTGIDASFQYINEAKKLEMSNLQFFQHDIRQPFWINYFDYAFSIDNKPGVYRTRREYDAGIRTVVQSLNNHGKLVLDFPNETTSGNESAVQLNLDHITKTLTIQGMRVLEVFGDYSLAPYYMKSSDRIIVIASR